MAETATAPPTTAPDLECPMSTPTPSSSPSDRRSGPARRALRLATAGGVLVLALLRIVKGQVHLRIQRVNQNNMPDRFALRSEDRSLSEDIDLLRRTLEA